MDWGILKYQPMTDRNVGATLTHLTRLGMSSHTWQVQRGLAVALSHKSFLYENRLALPGVTIGVLDALNALGGVAIQRAAAVNAWARPDLQTPGRLSNDVARVASSIAAWAVQQDWMRREIALGRGQAGQGLTPKVCEAVFRQVVGMLCLLGEFAVADALLTDPVAAALRGTAVFDPKTVLQEKLAPSIPEYSYSRSGPDHAAVFEAVVSDPAGRRAAGTGQSKKAADRAAALAFLERHHPEAVRAPHPPARVSAGPPQEIRGYPAHTAVVNEVQRLFHLPAAGRPLLSQALIHPSWAYEHRTEMAERQQSNNLGLALVGAHLLNFESLYAAAGSALSAPPEEFHFLTLQNSQIEQAFQITDLRTGLLLSVGLPEPNTEIAANAMQAVTAAVALTLDHPPTLTAHWPAQWAPALDVVAPNRLRGQDPTTLFEQAASFAGLTCEFEFEDDGGLDHLKRFRARLRIGSPVLKAATVVEGDWAVSKTKAKHSVAGCALEVLDGLADPAMATLTTQEKRALARFFLLHEACTGTAGRVSADRWRRARLFGFHLASDAADLHRWAISADDLLGSRGSRLPPESALQRLFRAAMGMTGRTSGALDTEIARVLDALARVDNPERLSQEYVDHLASLCDMCRTLGADDPDIALGEVFETWTILYPGRVRLPESVPALTLFARERDALDAAASVFARTGGVMSVEIPSAAPLRLALSSDVPADQSAVDPVCELWNGVSTFMTLRRHEEHAVEVLISRIGGRSGQFGPLARAMASALRPAPEPYRAAVADLLHDLKNEITAARTAVAHPPTAQRTERLAYELRASRHLDTAKALGLRLDVAASLSVTDPVGSIELNRFLRTYYSGLLVALPELISPTISTQAGVVQVAISEQALKAVLDNLVKNAVEAQPGGGELLLASFTDADEAVLVVADRGPGLPPDVAEALEAGRRVASSKPHGNGLGLMGVRSSLAVVGGRLELATSSGPGTRWLVRLPLDSAELASATPPSDISESSDLGQPSGLSEEAT